MKEVKVWDVMNKLFLDVAGEVDVICNGLENNKKIIQSNEGKQYSEEVIEAARQMKEAKDKLVSLCEGIIPDMQDEDWE